MVPTFDLGLGGAADAAGLILSGLVLGREFLATRAVKVEA